MNCVKCGKKYNREGDKYKLSKNKNEYVKYLGACSNNCFEELNEDHKDELFISAYINHYYGLRHKTKKSKNLKSK